MRSFRARNTSGKVVEIVVDDSDVSAELPTLRTSIGQRVNKLGPGRYEVVDSKEMLTSDDPSAF
jgi:hypothetical protein